MNIYKMTSKYTNGWGGRGATKIIVAANSESEAFELLEWRPKPKKTTAQLLGTNAPFKKAQVILKGEDWNS